MYSPNLNNPPVAKDAQAKARSLAEAVRKLPIDDEHGDCIGCGVYVFETDWEHDEDCVFAQAIRILGND